MKKSRILGQLFAWQLLGLMAVSCNLFKKNEPTPEKQCMLLYNSQSSTTYEYDANDQLTQLTGAIKITKFKYDKDGYLTQKTTGASTVNYEYANHLIAKIISEDGETNFEYDNNKRLSKQVFAYPGGSTLTHNYNNGKVISYIINSDGVIDQPFQFENGRVIRTTISGRTSQINDFDAEGRLTKSTIYDETGKKTRYSEFTYQDGKQPENANPENFFKGFPDEIKDIRPNGLMKTAVYYSLQGNSFVKTAENNYTCTLNQKEYATTITESSSSRNSSGTWVAKNPYKATYAYINCDE